MRILWFALISFGLAGAWADTKLQMVNIDGGSITPFWLEAITAKNKNAPANHKISVHAFATMAKQVTVRDFQAFLETHPNWKKKQASPLFADESYLRNLDAPLKDPDAPMTNVSWFAARAYCASLNMRLPTSNEWEYMGAASETSKDASSEASFLSRILEWYGEPQNGKLKRVGTVYRNVYGVWDLHGNVWEWVSDFNSNFISGESREDSTLNKDMFCGAGSQAGGNKENYAAFMRYAFRASLKGNSSTNNLGFRCVRSL